MNFPLIAPWIERRRQRRRERAIEDLLTTTETVRAYIYKEQGLINEDEARYYWNQIYDRVRRRRQQPAPERPPMHPTGPIAPAEHDPLFLKTLLSELEQASPARARKWLRSPEKGQKASGGVPSRVSAREAYAAQMQPSRIQFYGTPAATNGTNGIIYVDSAFPSTTTAPVKNISTTNHT